MRRLDRSGAIRPAKWDAVARRAVPDYAKFLEKAQEFEALPLTDPVRQAGFAAFAPDVLPVSGQGKPYFKSVWGRHKRPIGKISNWQCAYCECTMNSERVCQVEHFKPKARFPLSAYDWDNYLLACGGCNGPKSDNWPNAGQYVRPDENTFDPKLHFRFKEDGDVEGLTPDAVETIKDFELRRGLLLKDRKMFIDMLRAQIDIVAELFAENSASGERVAKKVLGSVSDPAKTPYSTALTQLVARALSAAIPGLTL